MLLDYDRRRIGEESRRFLLGLQAPGSIFRHPRLVWTNHPLDDLCLAIGTVARTGGPSIFGDVDRHSSRDSSAGQPDGSHGFENPGQADVVQRLDECSPAAPMRVQKSALAPNVGVVLNPTLTLKPDPLVSRVVWRSGRSPWERRERPRAGSQDLENCRNSGR